LDFNPLGEFVDGQMDVLVVTRGGFQRSYGVETPYGEGHDGGIVRRI
jgi:hypothetical protein